MAEIVGGLLMPHDPMLFTDRDAGPTETIERIDAAYREAADRLTRMDPTIVVIVGADHYLLFGPDCLPQVLVGIGDVESPLERLPGLDRVALPTRHDFARHLHRQSSTNGMDWAVAKNFVADHSIGIPYHLCVKDTGASVVPIYIASGVEPLIPIGRAALAGKVVADAVESWETDDRVAVIGSGGISHWVGLSDMGRVNSEFDRHILDCVRAGDVDALTALTDDVIVEQGGNGGLEIRQFVFAMAATGGTAETIDYVPAPEWITGLGFAELHRKDVA